MKVQNLSNDNITRFYQRIVTPLFSALKAVKSISSPLNYLQSELERYYDKKENFASIPHAPKILEFLESKDAIK